MLYDPIYGAYTELYAGLSPEVNASQNGTYSQSTPSSAFTKREHDHDYGILLLTIELSRSMGPFKPPTEERSCGFGEA